MSPKPKVLVVDDEEAIRSSLRMIFEYEGYECLLAATGPDGMTIRDLSTHPDRGEPLPGQSPT